MKDEYLYYLFAFRQCNVRGTLLILHSPEFCHLIVIVLVALYCKQVNIYVRS